MGFIEEGEDCRKARRRKNGRDGTVSEVRAVISGFASSTGGSGCALNLNEKEESGKFEGRRL